MNNLRLIISVLLIMFVLSCKDKPFTKSINLDKWNNATMEMLTKRMHFDTCLKYIPITYADYDTTQIIRNFNEDMMYKFSIRQKFIEHIKNQTDETFKYPLHIGEFYGRNSFGSIEYRFTVYENYRNTRCFTLNFSNDSFEQKNLNGEKRFWLYLQDYNSTIELGRYFEIEIVTLIKPKLDGDLGYYVTHVWAR